MLWRLSVIKVWSPTLLACVTATVAEAAAEPARLQFFALTDPSPDSRRVVSFARRELEKQVF